MPPHNINFRINGILISLDADFLQLISSSRKVFFPSDLHFDYTAPFDFLLRDHTCLIEVLNFSVILDSVSFLFGKSLAVGEQLYTECVVTDVSENQKRKLTCNVCP